jgi:putative oxidoreductase
MKYVVLLGRFLFSWIFLSSSLHHFTSGAAAYAQSQGVPMPSVLVPLSGVMALLGSISIILGFKAKAGAWLLVLFLVPVTLMMHKWWVISDSMMRQMQQVMFYKNMAMLGGALLISYFGAGPVSIDAMNAGRKTNNTTV